MLNTEAYHFPPELFDLLVQAIPVLCRSKKDVLLFFRGSGVPETLYSNISKQLVIDKGSLTKYDIVRDVLAKLNENTDLYLKQRRELLKRVSEFESFSNCWPADQFAARGYVSEIRKIIQTKDAFTRMELEREQERKKHQQEQKKKAEEISKENEKIENVKRDFYSLFSIENAQVRGKKLESVLNSFFKANRVLIREAFTLNGDNNEGIIEQIDGVIEVDSHIYLVEMKWLDKPVSNRDVHQHLGRIFSRPRPNGIFISASGYTDSAIIAAKEGLIRNAMFILIDFAELMKILEDRIDLTVYLRDKILAAIMDKNPYHKPIRD